MLEVTDPQRQVRADFDNDSGLVEVVPVDKDGTGYTLGVREDDGRGAFVRLTAAQASDVAIRLYPSASFVTTRAINARTLSDATAIASYLTTLVEMGIDGEDAMRLALDYQRRCFFGETGA